MSQPLLRETVVSAIREVAPETGAIEPDPHRSFRDQMDLDSVDYLRYVLTLEKSLGIDIPDADYPKLSSLNGAIAYLQSRTRSA